MKEVLLDIITKIKKYINSIIKKTSEELALEERKSGAIRVMYNSIIEDKRREENTLFNELKDLRIENRELQKQICKLREENEKCEKKINAITSFQHFLLEHKNLKMF